MTRFDRFGPNAWLVEEHYARYRRDPDSVDEGWRSLFDASGPEEEGRRERGAAERTPSRGKRTPALRSMGRGPAPMSEEDEVWPLTGAAAVIAERIDESLAVPTATSVRTVPARLLELNRDLISRHLRRIDGGKVSFTHLIGFAIVKALAQMPRVNRTFRSIDGRPTAIEHRHVNLGIAVDVARGDGPRLLLVPNIPDAETLDFAAFRAAYNALIRKARRNELSPDDFAGTTVTITNPG
ncbi:MAG TPA: 2-oxo acid dehydrogenase subunit E2, partial [Actinomycetota bacterium]|nr:2-oxo acid dehydrogenase subunit E2 [Actinomycetota bacterium]